MILAFAGTSLKCSVNLRTCHFNYTFIDFILPFFINFFLGPIQETEVGERAGCSALEDILGGFAHEQSGEGAAQCGQQTDPLSGE